jgi:hypothetical protein
MDRFRPFDADRAPPAPPALAGMRFSELIGALSHALDLTEGQPKGHCVRVCWIGTHIGTTLGLPVAALRDLYYTLLLKDLGCSSNAARICELYLTDDLAFKRDFKTVGTALPDVLRFVFTHTGLNAGLAGRLRSIVNILRNGPRITDDLIKTRCTRGADIARRLRFGNGVAAGIASLDEHWDGSGRPEALAGDAIPLNARIALLAQVIDVFHAVGGPGAALAEARERAGSWFDPALVAAMESVGADPAFWRTLAAAGCRAGGVRDGAGRGCRRPRRRLPRRHRRRLRPDRRQQEPVHERHSARVAEIVDAIARRLGCPQRAAGGCAAARCCTTSASSASATRCSTSRASSTPTSGS